MRPKSFLLIVIALGCGLVASIGISEVLKSRDKGGAVPLETETIYVALNDIGIGESINPKMVQLEDWPKGKVPPGAIADWKELENKRPRSHIVAGMPILQANLINPGDGDANSERIPAGYRVKSIDVDMSASVSNLLKPGDRVDVLCYLRRGTEVVQTETRTILENVQIFAVNDQVNRQQDKEEEGSIKAKTVSLLVTPKQAEKLMLAGELGSLQLTLRPPGDDNEAAKTADRGTAVNDLGLDREGSRRGGGGAALNQIPEFFTQMWAAKPAEIPAVETPQTPQGAVVIPEKPWTMDILSPDGVQRWEINDSGLPVMVGGSEEPGQSYVCAPVPDFPVEEQEKPAEEEENPFSSSSEEE